MARGRSALLFFGLAFLAQTHAAPIAQSSSSPSSSSSSITPGTQVPQQYPGSSSPSSAGSSSPTASQLLALQQAQDSTNPSSTSTGSQSPTAAQLLAIQRQGSGSSVSPGNSSPTAAQLLALQQGQRSTNPSSPSTGSQSPTAAQLLALQRQGSGSSPTAAQLLAQQSQDSKTSASPVSATSPIGSASSCPGGEIYTVQSGDSCELIARAKHVSTGTLVGVNKIGNECRNLQPGQKLCVPPPCMTHAVKSGETCFLIASAFAKALGKPYTVEIFRSINP